MKMALAQINTCVGNVAVNLDKMAQFLSLSQTKKVDLTVFPELCVVGYPPRDHVFVHGFVESAAKQFEAFIQKHAAHTFVAGTIEKDEENRFYNVAVVVKNGKIVWKQRKSLLPTYDVFHEERYFEKGTSTGLIEIAGKKVGLSICEDIWASVPIEGRHTYAHDPVVELHQLQMDVHINISASPYVLGKESVRLFLFKKMIEHTRVPFVFCNLVGGNDDVVFDGGSLCLSSQGQITAQAEVFKEDLICIDIDEKQGDIHPWPQQKEAWKLEALSLGVKDFFKKCTQTKAFVGLSGGIDSAVTACVAVQALGKENVCGVSMPSVYTSQMSKDDAKMLAKNLGIEFLEVPISPVVESYEKQFKLLGPVEKSVTLENLQARIRGNILMALSNDRGGFVLGTGNKSELATGYCTLYGDMCGALAVLSDLYKHEVYSLAAFINRDQTIIPKTSIERAPSAELKPNQTDQDTLPPYDQLDDMVKKITEDHFSKLDLIEHAYTPELVSKVWSMIERAEFKRKQSPPGIKITSKAFGVGWQMNIARGKSE